MIRAARRLRLGWDAYDKALEKTALRKVLARKYGTSDPIELKRNMLMDAFRKENFLARWVAKNEAPVTKETLYPLLIKLSKAPY